MSAEDRKSCSASLNDRFLVFALIYPGFLTISCNGFVRFRLSASREEEGLKLRQHLAEEEKRRRGGGGEVSKMWQQATAFCARPHYQREVTPVRERSAGQSRLPVSLISSPFLGLAAWLSQRQKEVFTFATD